MKTLPADTRERGTKRKKTSFRATWKALRGITFNHFPLILPGVHPLLAPLIMFRLKRRGFSNCKVEVSRNGLIIHADR
jgi:hypothetical protein